MDKSIGKSPKSNAATASPSLKNGDVQFSKNLNQATLKFNKDSILLWRRALLIRYFKILGDEANMKVKWCDYDSGSRIITINDENKPFEWKLPQRDLFKSAVTVTGNKKKKCVITLFYTTQTALVQGQMTQEWVKTEYPIINKTVNELLCSKGDKSINTDKILQNIEFDNELLFLDSDEGTNLAHQNLTMNTDSEDNVNKITISPIINSCEQTINNKELNNNEHKRSENESHRGESKLETENDKEKVSSLIQEQAEEIENLKTVIHIIETNQIEREDKINKVVTLCSDMMGKMSDLTNQITNIEKEVRNFKTLLINQNENGVKSLQKSIDSGLEKLKTEIKSEEINKLMNETKTEMSKCTLKMEKVDSETKHKVEKIGREIIEVKELIANKLTPKNSDHYEENEGENSDTSELFNLHMDNSKEIRNSPQKSENRNDRNKDTHDIWIIGTSLVKDLRAKKMYRNKSVRITTLQDKTVSGAVQFIKTGKVKSNNILFQIGSNDLDEKSPDDVMKDIEKLVDITKESLPHAKILFAELIPRFYNNINMLTQFEQKRQMLNSLLKDYCYDLNSPCIKFGSFSSDCFYDGIHFNEKGVRIYVKSLKEVLNPILGINFVDHNQDQNYATSKPQFIRGNNYGYDKSSIQANEYDNRRSGQVNTNQRSRYTNYNGRPQYQREQYDRFPSYRRENYIENRHDQNQYGQRSDVSKENVFRLFERMLSAI